jgi:SAM-dependent methyltransferase
MRPDDLYTTDEYLRRNPTYHVEDAPWKASHVLTMMERHGLSPATVCEVGCGAGQVLVELQGRMPPGVRFHGYDVSAAAIDLCRRKANRCLDFTCSDVAAIPSPAAEMLLCLDVIEHVPDCPAFLRALLPLAPYKLFHIPVELSLYKCLVPGRLRLATARYGHVRFFTRTSALRALEEAGHQIVDDFYTVPGVECGKTLESRIGAIPVTLVSRVSPGLSARLFGAHSLMVLAR